jgi:hypothetical protein
MARPVLMRRRVALLGILAILFQAILFGWHHHPLILASHGAPPVAHGADGAPLSPATAEDDCDICQALHHLNGAPGEFVVLAAPGIAAAPERLPRRVAEAQPPKRAFQARAPPRA